MLAGLLAIRDAALLAGDGVIVHTAGTQPGRAMNAESIQSLAEMGIDIGR